MQWSQIKTLFILTFLILNIYLAVQLINKQKQADLAVLEHGQSSFEEVLQSENITIPDSLQDEAEERFISVRQKVFTEEDIEGISGHDNLDTVIVNKNLLVSVFDKPLAIPKDSENSPGDIKGFLQDYIAFADDYKFWNWNKDLNILIFSKKNMIAQCTLIKTVYYSFFLMIKMKSLFIHKQCWIRVMISKKNVN